MTKKTTINYVTLTGKDTINKPPIYKLLEPHEDELDRIRYSEFSKKAKEFAYKVETIPDSTQYNEFLESKEYIPVQKVKSKYYSRYKITPDSPSMGVILTNIDLNRISCHDNGEPILWQMGPDRIKLSLAQRALFFDKNQNEKTHKIITDIENGKKTIESRSNNHSKTIEKALGMTNTNKQPIYTPALSELGYKKISSRYRLSRREILKSGLINKIGKYPRKIIGLGAMPPVTGWRDVLVISALGHMVSFIPRNSIYAGNSELRIKLANDAKKIIDNTKIPSLWKKRAKRNIGAAVGLDNPKKEIESAKKLFDLAGIKLFRIYTIGSDPRVINIAKLLRKTFGNKIEIFVGQIADTKQAERLIHKDIQIDGLVFGHGGGQQCTSAINGMAISTVEDIYQITLNSKFNNTSILVEGGVGRSIGTALIMGIDCCLGNQKFVRGTIETGNLFTEDLKGKICQPYPGSASPVTQIIESEDPKLRIRRTDAAGRTFQSEGKPGFMYYEQKACSLAFWINEYLSHAARTLADLGVKDINSLRIKLKNENQEYLRIMSEKTQYLSEAHWSH